MTRQNPVGGSVVPDFILTKAPDLPQRCVRSLVVFAAMGFLTVACSSTPSEVCLNEGRYSAVIDIRDSVTHAPLASGSRVRLEAQGFVDSVTVTLDQGSTSQSLRVGIGRNVIGVFTVTVTRPGYRPWIRSGVQVRGDRCGVANTVSLVADLQAS